MTPAHDAPDLPTVLFVSTPGGLGGSTRSLANVLAALKGEVTRVVTTTAGGKFALLVDELGAAEVTLPIISNQARGRPLRRAAQAVRLTAWTWRHRRSVVAIHANGLKELSVVAPAVFLTRLPLVVWVHNHTLPPSIRILGRVWRVLLRRRDVRWAAVSPTGRARAVEAGLVRAADVTIVPNPIDPEDVRADARQPSPRLRVAYLGSPEEYKGFRLVPELIERTADLPVDWLVFTAQTSDANADTWSRLRQLEAAGRVELVGKLPDVRRAYARCDIVVCPSFRDSFCRVAAEAMLNGIPVVGSDLEPIQALLGADEAGLVFPRGDVDAAVAAIARLVTDDDLRRRLGAAGPPRAARFSTHDVVEQLRALYGLRAA